MKKKAFIILAFLLAASGMSAQNFLRRGLALGADNDTLLYIIASPFDNWYINVGGSIQTFIGNELDASARRNRIDYGVIVELGKWIIPDISVSLRLSFSTVNGQSRYSKHPLIDYTGTPTHNENGSTFYEYQPFSAYNFAFLGFVTLDWTNFIRGYDRGKRTKLHWFTPVGLGGVMLFGKQKNPVGDYEVGSFRRNFELAFDAGIGAEYTLSKSVAVSARTELFITKSTYDWSPYNNSYSNFDLTPSFNINFRFNFIHKIKKYNRQNQTSEWISVNHEFLSFGTRQTIPTLRANVSRLTFEKDSILNSNQLEKEQAEKIADSLEAEIKKNLEEIALLKTTPLHEELLDSNQHYCLPTTTVYFQIDKATLDYNGTKKLEDFAREVQSVDDTAHYYIIGAADSLTGSARHNQRLSERRCKTVADKLVKKYGVPRENIEIIAVGGIMQYDIKENNRMAMIIQRTPETMRIVDRWKERNSKKK